MSIIEGSKLTKVYHYTEKAPGLKGAVKALFNPTKTEKVAVSDFNFKVEEGEFIGLIGPNGAGKTTLIKMLTGIIRPTSGKVSVLGYNPNDLKDDFKKKFAVVMGQKSQLWWDLPAYDSFLLNKELYEIENTTFKKNLDYFVELFSVESLLNVQVRQLSLGERMKMELISCLLHNPQVLFLDEPTIGLDAIAQKQIRQFLLEINQKKGITILLTSHYMEDIKRLCKRVMVINKGQKIYDGALESLFSQFKESKVLTVSFDDEYDITFEQNVEVLEKNKYSLKIKVQKDILRQVLQYLFSKYEIRDISIEEDDIGLVVEKIYTHELGVS